MKFFIIFLGALMIVYGVIANIGVPFTDPMAYVNMLISAMGGGFIGSSIVLD